MVEIFIFSHCLPSLILLYTKLFGEYQITILIGSTLKVLTLLIIILHSYHLIQEYVSIRLTFREHEKIAFIEDASAKVG